MPEELNLLKAAPEAIQHFLLKEDHPDWTTLSCNPSFSIRWVVFFLKRSRPVPKMAVTDIFQNKNFRKFYEVNLWLLRCKTAPPHVSISLIHLIRWVDLFWTLRLPYLPGPLRVKLEMTLTDMFPRLSLGEKTTMARQAPRPLIKHLRTSKDRRVLEALFRNYYFTHDDALFLVNYHKAAPVALELLAQDPKWSRYKDVRVGILRHEATPNALRFPLIRELSDHDLRILLRGELPVYSRRLIHSILEARFEESQQQQDRAANMEPKGSYYT